AAIQSIPNTRQHLGRILQTRPTPAQPPPFVPERISRLLGQSDFSVFHDGALSNAFAADKHVALFDFESTVVKNLSGWIDGNLHNEFACVVINSCLEQYTSAALSFYTQDAADRSIMILTVIALWVALDKLVATQHPLLLDYSPEIPESIIDVLLLRSSQHIEEARKIQLYLRGRHTKSKAVARGSIFAERNTTDSFAVQYFNQSPDLQKLKENIEEDAQSKRDKKLQEMRSMNDKHAQIVRQAQDMDCECPPKVKRKKRTRCQKCLLQNTAKKMRIDVHEWPLPAGELDAKTVVFELGCPRALNHWRSATYHIIRDLGRSPKDDATIQCTLADYQDLAPWSSQPKPSIHRITIASSTKPFIRSHYKKPKIPASQSTVCVKNGLQFKLYDLNYHAWASWPFSEMDFSYFGTFTLPEGSSYQHLRYALEGTSHTSNQVLADQSDCPQDISLHEHYAFGILRSGPRLQWMNIARGLEENHLSFNRIEADLLHTQAAWQVGPLLPDNQSREWHMELVDPRFGRLLVEQALSFLNRVRGNWLEATSVRTIVMLVIRLLAATTDDSTQRNAYKFLREARRVTFKWLQELLAKLQTVEIQSQVTDYQQRICEMAAICRSTYDVDMPHIPKVFTTTKDYHVAIFCLVTLYDNQPLELGNLPSSLQVLICRDRRFTHKIAPIVIKVLARMPRLLDGAILQCWNSYRPGSSGWTSHPDSGSRWVSATSESSAERSSQQVFLNLLEGRLLVDGKPLGRLPKEYIAHPTYIRIFGEKVLDVVPSSSPGMEFTARSLIEAHEVSFHLDGSTAELIIRARTEDATLELVSPTCLLEDFPLLFSSDYHHWITTETGAVEFRPLSAPWTSRNENWWLRPTDGSTYTMEQLLDNQMVFLMDSQSLMFRSIIDQICPLEDPRYIHVTILSSASQRLLVQLPRMKLDFFMNDEQQLESNNFRGLVVDKSQFIGTMLGLHNRLVLRAKDPIVRSLPRSRCVLIPYGNTRFAAHNGHVCVTIDPGSSRHVACYQYKIDVDLGCLASNAGLTGRLFKIYLHALTSYCLPDRLTGRTGTEEALYELSESATLSFDDIDAEQAHLLQLIGNLTPKRTYYPVHLKSMMTIHWHDLSPLAQHFAFCISANTILNRAQSLRIFNSSSFDMESYTTKLDGILLARAARRTHAYYPLDAAIRLPIVNGGLEDKSQVHTGRNFLVDGWVEQGQTALWASNLIHEKWKVPIYTAYNLTSLAESWGVVHGPSPGLALTYSSDWVSLNLPHSWMTVYNLCRQASVQDVDRYRLCYCLVSAAYSGQLPRALVPVVLAFANSTYFLNIAPPTHPSYHLSDKHKPTSDRIQAIISANVLGFASTPAHNLARFPNEATESWTRRQREYYNSNISRHTAELTQTWANSWPDSPLVPVSTYSLWFNLSSCLEQVRHYFMSCSRNLELLTHLRMVENILASCSRTDGLDFRLIPSGLDRPTRQLPQSPPFVGQPRLEELMQQRLCPESRNVSPITTLSASKDKGLPADTTRLEELLANFRNLSGHPLHQLYGKDLEASRTELEKVDNTITPNQLPSVRRLLKNRQGYRSHLKAAFQEIGALLGPCNPTETAVSAAGIWPRITPRTILGRLALWARATTPPAWLNIFVEYARAYVEYQRSHRLIILATQNKREEFYKELDFMSESTTYYNHPDWLLIDGNFSIRSIQTQVANEMISPSSGSNTILQLNMGEGKSSVIVPIIAASLADSSQLVRVVVLKPLWRQMLHLLVSRLGGLVNRRVHYLPFSRNVRVDHERAKQILNLYIECMREGGILLVQPEHILSFKLMGIDRLISSASPQEAGVANELHDMQQWLSNNTRDILDESDEILHVRYQLVYTVGEQLPLEGHPDRWTTTQQVLPLVAKHIARLKQKYLDKLKCEVHPGGQFPLLRIMPDSDEVVAELIQSVASDAMAGQVPNLNFGLLSQKTRENILNFLIKKDLPEDAFTLLEDFEPPVRNGLLLLRGLLACGILVFALRDKHYRVDYGLHLSRSLLAVPYHAKDIPSLRAEFGHPDVAIVLTCLSYYYHGLTNDQLGICFELLYKLDNPALEYEQWVRGNKAIPLQLRQLSGVNLKDQEQFTVKLLPAFSCNSAVVDFFLSSVVFPKAAKQFPHKLSTSGWDLAEVKGHVTTGFSGTNDNRYLLPASISQSDPVKQSSTNALVLTYLLRPENNYYLCARGVDGKMCSAKEFLNMLVRQNPEIRVLLDVGAQMLDLQNDELVKYWLELRPDVSAAVYFNNMDELVILPQNGSPISFFSSPFAQQLDKCIVYLDDGHTRGTDLDLPRQTRAAVTLGPKVTKDRLLQGCMRMRKLGHGQSVVFCAPAEVDSQIRKAARLAPESRVNALDVLRWAMLETCKDLEHHISHWAQQGIEYSRRTGQQALTSTKNNAVLKNNWMTPEYRPLQDMYGVSSSTVYSSRVFTSKAFGVPGLKERLQNLGASGLDDPSMGEEQEREVSQEIEHERQVERPLKSYPATHMIHEDVRHFVRTGNIPPRFKGLLSLFCPVSLSGFPKPGTWSPKLLASVDFLTVLESHRTSRPTPNEYMRPVHWILSGSNGTLIALSPYEANELIPQIRGGQHVRLHTYSPRISRSMISFSDLRFHTIPAQSNPDSEFLGPSAQLQLNLFAGQLYLDDYSQYLALCSFLGVYSGANIHSGDNNINVQSDGFIAPGDRERLGDYEVGYFNCGFQSSPIGALKDLIGHRRRGMDYLRTHVGQILHARQLTPNNF
ncbi:hypothetical protein FRC07_000929, partial [Ceratobasidium sp. 392]